MEVTGTETYRGMNHWENVYNIVMYECMHIRPTMMFLENKQTNQPNVHSCTFLPITPSHAKSTEQGLFGQGNKLMSTMTYHCTLDLEQSQSVANCSISAELAVTCTQSFVLGVRTFVKIITRTSPSFSSSSIILPHSLFPHCLWTIRPSLQMAISYSKLLYLMLESSAYWSWTFNGRIRTTGASCEKGHSWSSWSLLPFLDVPFLENFQLT